MRPMAGGTVLPPRCLQLPATASGRSPGEVCMEVERGISKWHVWGREGVENTEQFAKGRGEGEEGAGRRDPPCLAEQGNRIQRSRPHPTRTLGSFRRCSPDSERPVASPPACPRVPWKLPKPLSSWQTNGPSCPGLGPASSPPPCRLLCWE